MMRVILILTTFTSIINSSVFAASLITVTDFPLEVKTQEEFTVDFAAEGLSINTTYYTKIRLGNSSSELNKGETFNPLSVSWLGDTSAWTNFPLLTTDSEGRLIGNLRARFKTTVVLGENHLLVRLRKTENDQIFDSNMHEIMVLESPTATPTLTLTPSLTPTVVTPTLTPIPAEAIYKINAVKNEEGDILASVKIYVNNTYTSHYAPEELKFCSGCSYVLGENKFRLEKNGYQNWEETKNFQAGDFFEVNPIMAKVLPTATSKPSAIPTSTSTPTVTPTVTSSLTPKPSPTIFLSPTESPPEILGEKFEAINSSPTLSPQFKKSSPVLPFLAIGLGLFFVSLSVFLFFKKM